MTQNLGTEAANLSTAFLAKLDEWQKLQDRIAHMTQLEQQLRRELFEAAFPDPVEGTNKFPLHGGYVLNASYKINRTLDKAGLSAASDLLKEAGYSIDPFVRYKPELEVKAYKGADSAVRKILDLCITAKPGMPTLEIVLPKSAAR